ncbi:unnamed protein product [Bathycoccus prasinos]|jgi:photosystem I subunit 2|uniref:Photosystem I reaction center subunit II, chloroplastic n=1 Tax=Bathycoccus prasinos TaxID=41875 RepID=K8EHR6_9CHLO|nr:predicted protein [Bathycoccus prasinos]CCO17549.1 predicted protein [Bathycoccus prasinos]|eukprot:XP_007511428.1 predicted protein [Bathycoccus prasinos]
MASLTSSVAFAIKSSPKLSSKTNSRAQFTNNNKSASSFGRKNQSFQIVRAEGEAAPAWSAPKLDPNTPSPIFGGSTGGLLRKAQVEEFYVLTWEAKKEQIFEMPTGGAAIMRKGPNLLKLARKEQCMALVTTFRAKKIANGCIYRVFPSGEVQYLHPKDGVYPEKVNAGRVGANQNMRSIGKNTNPVNVKFQGKGTFDV